MYELKKKHLMITMLDYKAAWLFSADMKEYTLRCKDIVKVTTLQNDSYAQSSAARM
jgi:hypothetical protein